MTTQEPPSLYTPPGSRTLDKAPPAQWRLGIQGFWGTGKSFSAMTFPNPMPANLDRGLGAHMGRKDIIELPFYENDFSSLYSPNEPDNLKIAVMEWIRREGPKVHPSQTFVLDGLTRLDSAYHTDWKRHPAYSKSSGKIDDYAEYGLKLGYFGELCDLLVKLDCNVILITHEFEKTDAKNPESNGKIRPLMSGSYCNKIGGQFTDWFRQLTCEKPDISKFSQTDWDGIKRVWCMTPPEYKTMLDSFPRNTIYYWQTESDNFFDAKAGSLVNFPTRIPANWESFKKYMRFPTV